MPEAVESNATANEDKHVAGSGGKSILDGPTTLSQDISRRRKFADFGFDPFRPSWTLFANPPFVYDDGEVD